MFKGTLFVVEVNGAFIATLTLPPGQPIQKKQITSFRISGPNIPMGTDENISFKSVKNAVSHFTSQGFILDKNR